MCIISINCCDKSSPLTCRRAVDVIMSKQLDTNKNFIKLLLNTTKDQASALLDTITKEQIRLISEISLNVLNLDLPKKATQLVQRKKKLFEKLSKKQTPPKTKQSLIRKNYKHIILTLWSLKPQLEQLL